MSAALNNFAFFLTNAPVVLCKWSRLIAVKTHLIIDCQTFLGADISPCVSISYFRDKVIFQGVLYCVLCSL